MHDAPGLASFEIAGAKMAQKRSLSASARFVTEIPSSRHLDALAFRAG
jgi:hypothetical protein